MTIYPIFNFFIFIIMRKREFGEGTFFFINFILFFESLLLKNKNKYAFFIDNFFQTKILKIICINKIFINYQIYINIINNFIQINCKGKIYFL